MKLTIAWPKGLGGEKLGERKILLCTYTYQAYNDYSDKQQHINESEGIEYDSKWI